MTHAAQVSLTLFADSAHKQNRTFGVNSFAFELPGRVRLKRQDRNHHQRFPAQAICFPVLTTVKSVSLGKHRVEMRADNQQRRSRSSFEQSETIAFFVDLDFSESEFENFSLRYSARSCSPKGLAGIEQMRMCSSVIASALVSKKRKRALRLPETTRCRLMRTE